MNSIKLSATAQIPSYFGMPMSGHAFGASAAVAGSLPSAALVVRDRVVATDVAPAATAGLRFGPTTIPGTSAWRPPSC